MREPKSQVRRERKRVQQTILTTRSANFHDPAGRRSQIANVMLRKQKRRRFRAAPGGKSHENGPKFRFKLAPDLFAAMCQCPQDCAWTMLQNFFVRNQNEVFESVWAFGRADEIRFRSEWDVSQIFERMNRLNRQADLIKNLSVVSRERQNH